MSATSEALRNELKDQEYSEGYAESFLDSYVATQIKVLREHAGLSQDDLAKLIGTRQGVISRIENVNYSKWSVATLKKLARAFNVRLKISFETYGSLIAEVESFSRASLQCAPRDKDPILYQAPTPIQRRHRAVPRAGKRHQPLYGFSSGNNTGFLHEQLSGSTAIFSSMPKPPASALGQYSQMEAVG